MIRTSRLVPVVALFLLAAAALLAGLWAGLARLGWQLPASDGALAAQHGGLMVGAFVATVVTLERAVASGRSFWLVVPACSAAGGIAMLIRVPGPVAPLLATACGVGYSALLVSLMRQRQVSMPLALMLIGALCLAFAGTLWGLDRLASAVPWWMAFLLLTIAAERLEILRFRRFSAAAMALGAVAVVTVLAGAAVTALAPAVGPRIEGAGLALAALWLLLHDYARRTVLTAGLARYAATGVLSAYGWLLVSGLLLVGTGLPGAGFAYDATVHAFFVGFVFGAIEAHMPIMVPALTGLTVPFSRGLYVPLALLHGSLALRIGSDLAVAYPARQWAGLLQVVAIVVFLGASLFLIARAVRARA